MTATKRVPLTERGAMGMADAAAYVGLNPDTLRPYVDSGEIPSALIESKRLILRADLDRWLAARRDRTTAMLARPARKVRVA